MGTAIATFVSTILAPILVYLVKLWTDKATKKDKAEATKEKMASDIASFKEECLRAVKKVDLEYALAAKANGTFSPDKALSLAIEAVKAHYGPDALVDLAMLFAVDAEGLMAVIKDTIESAILLNKKAGSISLQDEPNQLPGFLKIK